MTENGQYWEMMVNTGHRDVEMVSEGTINIKKVTACIATYFVLCLVPCLCNDIVPSIVQVDAVMMDECLLHVHADVNVLLWSNVKRTIKLPENAIVQNNITLFQSQYKLLHTCHSFYR